MNINHLCPFGVEVIGFEYASADIDHATLAHHTPRAHVAVCRDQRFVDAVFVRFLIGFGSLVFTTGETPVSGLVQIHRELMTAAARWIMAVKLWSVLQAAYGLILSPPFAPCP